MHDSPENCDELFLWRAAEFIVQFVFQNPNYNSNNHEKYCGDHPHRERERAHKGPRARVQFPDGGHHDQPRLDIRLREVHDLGTVGHDRYVTNNRIKYLHMIDQVDNTNDQRSESFPFYYNISKYLLLTLDIIMFVRSV